MIYTLHDRAPWQAGIRAGLHARIEQIPQATRPVVYEEWLDASRLPGPQAEAAFLALLAGRYAGVKLDAVAAESEAAINLLNRHPELFPGAKRYLVGTSVKLDAVGDADVVRLEEDPVGALQTRGHRGPHPLWRSHRGKGSGRRRHPPGAHDAGHMG
ncbi:MAG: hypothetical protein ACO1PM_18695 [Acidovorax sp.]